LAGVQAAREAVARATRTAAVRATPREVARATPTAVVRATPRGAARAEEMVEEVMAVMGVRRKCMRNAFQL
jgi:hypothetical protein